jgi:hypothetical protein
VEAKWVWRYDVVLQGSVVGWWFIGWCGFLGIPSLRLLIPMGINNIASGLDEVDSVSCSRFLLRSGLRMIGIS